MTPPKRQKAHLHTHNTTPPATSSPNNTSPNQLSHPFPACTTSKKPPHPHTINYISHQTQVHPSTPHPRPVWGNELLTNASPNPQDAALAPPIHRALTSTTQDTPTQLAISSLLFDPPTQPPATSTTHPSNPEPVHTETHYKPARQKASLHTQDMTHLPIQAAPAVKGLSRATQTSSSQSPQPHPLATYNTQTPRQALQKQPLKPAPGRNRARTSRNRDLLRKGVTAAFFCD
jgi:hypothetical protein